MSYDHNIYVGWYAEFTPTTEKKEVGVGKTRVCNANHSHKIKGGQFCSVCGSAIVTLETKKMKSLSLACHMQGQTDGDEIEFQTLGRGTKEDLDTIFEGKAHAIFPEFLPTKKTIIMSDYSDKMSDVARSDGQVQEISQHDPQQMHQWHQAWSAAIEKVFGCTDLAIKYGIVHEVV